MDKTDDLYRRRGRRLGKLLLALAVVLVLAGCGTGHQAAASEVVKGQPYYDTADVAAYLHTYGQLPPNYLTKAQARALGWDADKGNLWDVTDRGCIGGDVFTNREGHLPEPADYHECDVNYQGGFRGADRLIYDGGGAIYYTGDHYQTFTQLY